MIEKMIPLFFASYTEMTDLIGSATVLRVFPLIIPQKQKAKAQLPCVVYTVTGEERQKVYCGTSSLVRADVSLDFYASDILQARQLSNTARRLLLDYRGPMGDYDVRDVSLVNSMTQVDMDPGLMRVIDMYSIWYEERSN